MTDLRTEEMMRAKQARTDKRRYLKVRPSGFGSWATMEPAEAQAVMTDLEDYEVAEVWMTAAEFEALPDHGGW